MDPDKFAKVLAMAESDHHGEAVSALRAARIMLARSGLSFRDLAGVVQSGGLKSLSKSRAGGRSLLHGDGSSDSLQTEIMLRQTIDALENDIVHFEAQIRDLYGRLERQKADVERQKQDFERQRSENDVQKMETERLRSEADRYWQEIERQRLDLEKQRQETDRWQNLARETVERLWDLGQSLNQNDAASHRSARRLEILNHLRDPILAQDSDESIGNRLGRSPVVVAWWRRRLAPASWRRSSAATEAATETVSQAAFSKLSAMLFDEGCSG
ncbi:putative Winged helix-turn-helix domain-containing protein [Azospirillaceae bacterium]